MPIDLKLVFIGDLPSSFYDYDNNSCFGMAIYCAVGRSCKESLSEDSDIRVFDCLLSSSLPDGWIFTSSCWGLG